VKVGKPFSMIDINAYNAYNVGIMTMRNGRAEMAVLNIRNLSDEVHRRLRLRAAKSGRSMEAEARAILTAACVAEKSRESASDLQDWVDGLYGTRKPRKVVERLIAERRKESSKE